MTRKKIEKRGKIWMKKSQKEGGERNLLFFPTVRIPSIFVGAILQLFGGNTIHTMLKKNLKSAILEGFFLKFFPYWAKLPSVNWLLFFAKKFWQEKLISCLFFMSERHYKICKSTFRVKISVYNIILFTQC